MDETMHPRSARMALVCIVRQSVAVGNCITIRLMMFRQLASYGVWTPWLPNVCSVLCKDWFSFGNEDDDNDQALNLCAT
jgi:hypothetical protein